MILKIIKRIYQRSPRDNYLYLKGKALRHKKIGPRTSGEDNVRENLERAMKRYTVNNLVGISGKEFQEYLLGLIGKRDMEKEGYQTTEKQRDLSVRFVWGHNHDFGSFKLEGGMQDRHIKLFENFHRFFGTKPQDFANKDVFDIGCWTGGTSLLFSAFGAKVTAIEEVKKYAEVTNWLAEKFGISSTLSVVAKSLYECDDQSYYDRFDYVHFSGVLYHLTDPVVALRILFNTLRPGGTILVESAGFDSDELTCRYQGCSFYPHGSKKERNRSGWNWFIPSKATLKLMLENAGFKNIRIKCLSNRLYAVAVKVQQEEITRAGLSRPNIR